MKVRFLADLVNAKVVASSSIMTLFDTFITVTYEPDIPHVRLSSYSCIIYEFAIYWGRANLVLCLNRLILPGTANLYEISNWCMCNMLSSLVILAIASDLTYIVV